MKKIALLSLLIFLSLPLLAAADEIAADGTTLEISAQAKSNAVPDIATISAGVTTSAPSADKALQDNTAKMNGVFKALQISGIAEKDIQTSGFSISPQYVYNRNEPPRITSYQVDNNVNIVLRNTGNIGATLDALIAQGANQIGGPTFSVENPDEALDKARNEAMSKAQKRAKLYAEAAGLRIKRIVSISEQGGYSDPRPYPVMMKAMAMSAAQETTQVSPGQVSLEITVNVRYELMP